MNEKPTKFYFRQRNKNRLYDAVIQAVEESAAHNGTRRRDIAETLGLPASRVTRLLSGPSNWESDTTSDLLFAIDAELDYKVVFFKDRDKSNSFHPIGEPLPPRTVGPVTTTTTSGSVSIVSVIGSDLKFVVPGRSSLSTVRIHG